MTNSLDNQKLSVAIMRDPTITTRNTHLDLLEAEDPLLSPLHPLAQVIALHERGATSRITRDMLQDATRTIILNGICGECSGDDSNDLVEEDRDLDEEDSDQDAEDDSDLEDEDACDLEEDEYDLDEEDNSDLCGAYYVRQLGRGSIELEFHFDSIDTSSILELECEMSYDMSGETVDSDATMVRSADKVFIELHDLPVAASLSREFSDDEQWLERLLATKSELYNSLSPGLIYLCGDVDIHLDTITIKMNGETATSPIRLDLPVARQRYHQGDLMGTDIMLPKAGRLKGSNQLFWPKWFPAVTKAAKALIQSYYTNLLSPEVDKKQRGTIRKAMAEAKKFYANTECQELYIDVDDLADIDNCRSPQFLEVSVAILSNHKLPEGWEAQRDFGHEGIRELLLKLAEIYQAIGGDDPSLFTDPSEEPDL